MKPIKMEQILTANNEVVYIDLNDVLDILNDDLEEGLYTIIFTDGSVYFKTKIKKTVYNKFLKIKKKRNQLDEVK